MKKKNGLLQTFFYDILKNSSDELGTGNTRHLRQVSERTGSTVPYNAQK
jgi:hypothetical protein